MRTENTLHLRSLILVLLMLTSFVLPILSPFEESEESLLDEEDVRMKTNMGPQLVVNVENVMGFGSSNIDRNHGFTGGPNGTAYVIGEFQGTLTFGNYSLVSSGSYFDGYVAKMTQGNWDWAVKIGGTSTDRTYGLAVDSSGNAFVTGNFYGTCHFYDKNGQSSGNLSSAGSADLYVAKLKPSGDWDWFAHIGSSNYSDGGNDIVLDNYGDAYLTGYIGNEAEFADSEGNNWDGTATTEGGTDAFVAKIDSTGSWKWIQIGGSSANDAGVRLDVGSNGTVVVGGYYQGEATFGSTTLSHWQYKEAFVAKVHSNGWVFAKGGTGNGDNTVRSVKFDSNGDIYYLTQFYSNLTMSSGFSSSNAQSTVVGKISGSTNLYVWHNVSSSSGVLNGINMALSPDGNLTVVGEYSGSASFAGQQFTRTGTSGQDGYIQGLNSTNGNQNYVFTIGSGGNNNDININDLMFDSNPTGGGASDIVAFSGYFKGTATFDSGNSLTSAGNEDGFLAKVKFAEEGCYIDGFDYNNATEWVHCAGTSSGLVQIKSTAVDSSGNSYHTGFFEGTAVFGSTILSSSGSADIFIAKLSSSGSWAWAVKAGGTGTDHGYGIAVDSSGNAHVTGSFQGTVNFGAISKTSSGSSDIFITKLSSSGGWIFADKAGGTGGDFGKAIAVDSTGNTYVTGHYTGTAYFGSNSLTSNGSDDTFAAKLSSSGSWSWVVKAGCSSSDKGNAIAVDSSGNAYLAGHFYGTIYFGSTSLTSSGSYDAFISKLSSSGSWQWAVKVGGTSGDEADGIAVDSSGNVYVTGFFSSTAAFGSTSLTSSGGIDVFVAKLSSSGSWSWAVKAGGTSSGDRGTGIAVDSNGNAYVSGTFKGTATFGSTSLTSSGSEDAFLAQISSTGSWVWANDAGGTGVDKGVGISLDGNGIGYLGGYFSGDAQIGMQNFICQSTNCGMFIKTPVYMVPLSISTSTTGLDSGTVGTLYSFTLSAT
nr:SBBP repeat-containing protein [Candidatus Poseidoniaceae archaeon]